MVGYVEDLVLSLRPPLHHFLGVYIICIKCDKFMQLSSLCNFVHNAKMGLQIFKRLQFVRLLTIYFFTSLLSSFPATVYKCVNLYNSSSHYYKPYQMVSNSLKETF